MRKFFFKLSLFFFSFFLFAFLLQQFIDKSIKHSKLLYFQTWNDIIDSKVNSDLIILGSSRAKVQFSPYVIDNAFHLKSCNLGMEGTGFNLQYCRFKLYIKYNQKPKYIIQNIDCTSTLLNNIFQFEQYIPYLDNEIIRNATFATNIFDFKDYFIPLYKYTHSLLTKQIITDGICGYIKNTHGKGAFQNFSSNNALWDSTFDSFQKSTVNGFRAKIDSNSKVEFENYLKFCKKENIKVIFVYAPEYKMLQKLILNRDSIVSLFRAYSIAYNMPLLDYSNDSICLNTKYFYNSQHMNTNGVNKFNVKLANDLIRIIN